MIVTVGCCLCSKEHKQEISLPDGWAHRYDAVDDESGGFCPDHAAVAPFAESQCPGCVGGWTDCPMWQAFAYTYGREIGDDDYASIERGICPRRVNGTMTIGRGGTQDLDISKRAPVEAGKAFAQAIRDYCAAYPARAA
jgi:hypothetical protein